MTNATPIAFLVDANGAPLRQGVVVDAATGAPTIVTINPATGLPVLTVVGSGGGGGAGTVTAVSGVAPDGTGNVALALSNLTGGTAQAAAIAAAIPSSQKGAASGVATLDGSGKVPVAQLPAAVLGALNYQGTYNATTNTPAIVAGNKGFYWKVATAGTSLGHNFVVGDWAVDNGATIDKIDGNENEVLSVAGKTGAVTLAVGDLTDGAATLASIGSKLPKASSLNATTGVAINPAGGTFTPVSGTAPPTGCEVLVCTVAGTLPAAVDSVTALALNDGLEWSGLSGVWLWNKAKLSISDLTDAAAVAQLNATQQTEVAGGATVALLNSGKTALKDPAGGADIALGGGSSSVILPMFDGASCLILPTGRGSTTFGTIGASVSTGGTATARTTALTYGYAQRIGMVSAASAGSEAHVITGATTETVFTPGTDPLYPTARFRAAFSVSDALSACRTAMGWVNNFVITSEPSSGSFTGGNGGVYFGADSTDSQLSLITSNGTTTTKTALNGGTGFPCNTNVTDVYEGYIEFVAGATRRVNYFIINKATGVKASGSVTATLPAAATTLRPIIIRGNVANTSAASFEFIGMAQGAYALMGATS